MNSYIIKQPTFSYFVLVVPSLRSEYCPGQEVQDFTKPPPKKFAWRRPCHYLLTIKLKTMVRGYVPLMKVNVNTNKRFAFLNEENLRLRSTLTGY